MALNPATLGVAIANKVLDPSADAETRLKITQLWTDIATEIITHFQTMGQVQVFPGQSVATNTGAGSTTTPGSGVIL